MYQQDRVKEVHLLKSASLNKSEVARHLCMAWDTVDKMWEKDPNAEVVRKTPKRGSMLDKFKDEIRSLYLTPHSNCNVICQILFSEHGVQIKPDTMQKYVRQFKLERKMQRQALADRARNRVESPKGAYLQIDTGQKKLVIGGAETNVHIFVAVLAYSRKVFATLIPDETADSWMLAIEDCFRYFGGKPKCIVCDNAAGLVAKAATFNSREVRLTEKYRNFCRHWKIKNIACLPRYPQSKGKCERAVGYVKDNALNECRTFPSLEAVEKHLRQWLMHVADARVMEILEEDGIKSETPAERFEEERRCLRAVTSSSPSFFVFDEGERSVDAKGQIVVQKRRYQLPLQFAKEKVYYQLSPNRISFFHQNKLILETDPVLGALKVITIAQFDDTKPPVFGAADPALQPAGTDAVADAVTKIDSDGIDRDASEYEELMDAKW